MLTSHFSHRGLSRQAMESLSRTLLEFWHVRNPESVISGTRISGHNGNFLQIKL